MYHNGKLVLCGANANGHFWKQFLSGDFSRRRLVVLDAATGEKAWAKDANYRTRPIIVGNEIIAEPWAFDLNRGYQKTRANPITGKDGPWQFVRPGHHCGAIAASSSMLFYRSWSMAYLDLNDDSGTRHFAGHRLGCWINQLPAGGVLVVPEASAGCVCSFSIAATVVMEPRPDREPSPGLFSAAGPTLPVNTLAINLAGGGDRHGKDGTLWFAYPRPEYSKRLEFEFNIDCDFAEGGGYTSESVKLNPVTQTDDPWLYTTQATGVRRLVIPLRNGEESDVDGVPGNATYTVRLHFAPLNTLAPPAPFDIVAQGRIVAPNVRLPTASDKTCPAIVKRFKDIVAKDRVTIEFRSRGGGPAANIAAIQITRETE